MSRLDEVDYQVVVEENADPGTVAGITHPDSLPVAPEKPRLKTAFEFGGSFAEYVGYLELMALEQGVITDKEFNESRRHGDCPKQLRERAEAMEKKLGIS